MSAEIPHDPERRPPFTPAVELSEAPVVEVSEFIRPNPRQQDKLLYVLTGGENEILFDPHFKLSDDEHNNRLAEVGEKLPGPEEMSALLRNIAVPTRSEDDPSTPADIFEMLDHEERIILAHFAKSTTESYKDVSAADIEWLVDPAHYPDLITFIGKTGRFLDRIKTGNGSEKREKYKQALETFERKVFGKQYDYYEQFRLMFDDQMQMDSRWQPEELRSEDLRLKNGVDDVMPPDPDFDWYGSKRSK